MWRSVILILASRAGLPTCLAIWATKAATAACEWLIAGATATTPAFAYSARLAVRVESSLSFASAILRTQGLPATPMSRSGRQPRRQLGVELGRRVGHRQPGEVDAAGA